MQTSRMIGLVTLIAALLAGVMTAPLPASAGNLELGGAGDGKIYIMQPLDNGSHTLDAEPGIDTFFTYFNRAWPWLVGTAAGVAVLQAIVGGVEIMISSGGEKKSAGVERLQWAIAGLIMLVLAGLILRTLNPIFYK